jgi:hypothetical protein
VLTHLLNFSVICDPVSYSPDPISQLLHGGACGSV